MNCVKTGQSREDLMCWLLRRMGAPQLKLEAYKANLEDAIDDAIRRFNSRKGTTRTTVIYTVPSQTVYPYPCDADGIIQISFSDTLQSFPSISTFNNRHPFFPGEHGFTGDLVQNFTYLKDTQKILSSDLDWKANNELKQITISPEPFYSAPLYIEYRTNKVNLETLSDRDFDFIRRYALAFFKKDLGRIRSYSNFSGSDGPLLLDGAMLLQEAARDIAEVDNEIKNSFTVIMIAG